MAEVGDGWSRLEWEDGLVLGGILKVYAYGEEAHVREYLKSIDSFHVEVE